MNRILVALSFGILTIGLITLKFTVWDDVYPELNEPFNVQTYKLDPAEDVERTLKTAGTKAQLQDEITHNEVDELEEEIKTIENEELWFNEFKNDIEEDPTVNIKLEDAPGAEAAEIEEIEFSLQQSLKDEWELEEE